ncbi:MAG: (2Fe-2S) ferredoxin domain-containing protein [Ruminococcaceae bacterium]|nr:(2Fe-2S) ferredoxin domain-containing protein [Oscillospiraceae bacterium]
MKSLEELKALKEKAKAEIQLRNQDTGLRVVVGMATCGIAAGARPVLNAFIDELNKRNINNVSVTMTGCIGMCRLEPIVEVIDQNDNKVTYVKMTAEKAARVVAEHIVNGNVVAEYTVGEELE